MRERGDKNEAGTQTMTNQNHAGLFVYIGTYTATESEGIYVYHLDPSSGVLEFASKAISVDNPAYLAIDPQCRCLYTVHV